MQADPNVRTLGSVHKGGVSFLAMICTTLGCENLLYKLISSVSIPVELLV